MDDLFDRILIHRQKFKDVETLVADVEWVVGRFPDMSVSQLQSLIADADKNNLLTDSLGGLVFTSKEALIAGVTRAAKSRIGVGNLIRRVFRSSGSEKADALKMLLSDCDSEAIKRVLTMFALVSDADKQDNVAEFIVNSDASLDQISLRELEKFAMNAEECSQIRPAKRVRRNENSQPHYLADWESRESGIHVFTDGSIIHSQGGSGPSAAFAVVWPEHEQFDVCAKIEGVTDEINLVELHAAVVAVKIAASIDPSASIPLYIHTDSQFIIDRVTAAVQPAAVDRKDETERSLLEELFRHAESRTITFKHIKAHTGHSDWRSVYNSVADQRAKNRARQFQARH